MYFTQFSPDSFLFGLQKAQLIKFIWEAICFREVLISPGEETKDGDSDHHPGYDGWGQGRVDWQLMSKAGQVA